MAKLKVMNSTIGRSPSNAAPTPRPAKPMLGDRRIDDALGAELLQQALADLVGALILARPPRPSGTRWDRGASPRPWRRAAPRARSWWWSGRSNVGLGRRGLWRSAARRAGCAAGAAPSPARRPARQRRPAPWPLDGVLALAGQQRDRRVDRHVLGARRDQDFRQLPSSTASTSIVALSVSISAITSPDLHHVALGFQPFGELALGHGRRQRGHQDFNRHRNLFGR